MPPLTPVVKNLIIINVVVFAALYLLPYLGIDTGNLADNLALRYPTSDDFRPYQLVSHFFVHGGLTHIFLNMFGLYMFGPLVERRYGSQRFLLLYLVAAAGAVALHFGWTWYEIHSLDNILADFRTQPGLASFEQFFAHIDTKSLSLDNGTPVSRVVGEIKSDLVLQSADRAAAQQYAEVIMQDYLDFKVSVPMVGASGAIYGIVAAFAILHPNLPLMLIFLPIPIKAKIFVPLVLLVDLVMGVMQFSWDPVAHFAHLGGALAGGLLAYLWYRTDPPAGTQRWDRGVPR